MDAQPDTNMAFTVALKCALSVAVLFVTVLPAVYR